jgi:L-threonylcarbamoyladenylate synthase
MQAVIKECGFPLAAPSANPANRLSPTCAAHVLSFFSGKIPLVVDGGPCQVGIESTVVDATARPVRLLRPGMIHEAAIFAVTGDSRGPVPGGEPGPLRSPGLLAKHYSPNAKLLVLDWHSDAELAEAVRSAARPERTHVLVHSRIPCAAEFGRVSVIPHDAEAFARALYAELHRCDEEGAELIVVEQLPAGPEWKGIADRLDRAGGRGA